jgi:hypothetical protein
MSLVLANGIRSYTNEVRLRGLMELKPTEVGFVCRGAVSNRQLRFYSASIQPLIVSIGMLTAG